MYPIKLDSNNCVTYKSLIRSRFQPKPVLAQKKTQNDGSHDDPHFLTGGKGGWMCYVPDGFAASFRVSHSTSKPF